MRKSLVPWFVGVWLASTPAATPQQRPTGVIRGSVTIGQTGLPVHHADVLIPRLGRKTQTGAGGDFEFREVPAGRHELVAHMHSLSDERKTVVLAAGGVAEVNFQLELAPVREQITVTASGREETAVESFLSVVSVNSLDMAAKSSSTSLGELLEDQAGVGKRSFGPGTSRPVIRGFDGDRVLVLEGGVRTGTLSSQSGDHGEPIDGNSIERVEVVRGPATLLYGSNAIGGVVNAISRHHEIHEHPHEGLRGHVSATAGSANAQGGGSASFEYGIKNWLLWGGGGGMRTGDYNTPLGRIDNSGTDLKQSRVGFGRYSDTASFSLNYALQDGRYGVPFASEILGDGEHGDEEIDIGWRRHQARLTGTIRELGPWLEQFSLKLNYTDWTHRELEGDEVGTRFFNKQLVYRGEFQQRARGPLTGSFGFWGLRRDYKSVGEEALAPPVDQNAFALFGLEQFDLGRVRLQFGGRLEHNFYDPLELRSRSFTGASGGAGLHVGLWSGGAFVANYTHSFRAPALEELYNEGPHLGNVTFEIGDDDLNGERGNGVDLSVRHQGRRFRGEANFFYYRLGDFIYLAPTGRVKEGLPEAKVRQDHSRFTGAEIKAQFRLREALWANLALDTVDAEIRATRQPLPRIPPVRGRAGLDLRYKSLSLRPELALSSRQDQLFANETHTAGYALANLAASYTFARQHALHVFSVNFFNMSDRLYRNHLSFIKELAPEIGRGVRFSYNLHIF